MTTDIDIDTGDDADYAIDTAIDQRAEAEAIEQDRIVTEAMETAQILTIMSRGKRAIAELTRRMMTEAGTGSDRAERVEQQILDGYDTTDNNAMHLKKQALRVASLPTRREVELQSKLNAANSLLDHYIKVAAQLRSKAA